jgi:hypothetical protein
MQKSKCCDNTCGAEEGGGLLFAGGVGVGGGKKGARSPRRRVKCRTMREAPCLADLRFTK